MPSSPPLAAADRARLAAVLARIHRSSETLVGYPCNQRFDYSELYPLLAYTINNVGDPFAGSNYQLNTHDIERDVVRDFAVLTRAEPDSIWGYVTSGGTEGNLYGLYLARELHPDGIVYYSEDTHYSVAKSLRLLHARSIMIRSLDNGEIDYEDLEATLRIHRDVPPIVFANIGTTMKGAIDDVKRIQAIMNDLRLSARYIHCDAALSGMVLPFVDDPPTWDFSADIDSLSISGHKMIGSPLPCGVALARRRNVERIARSVEYVGVLDTTIGGSRSAFAPVVLWYAMRRVGRDAMRQVVQQCLETADYTIEEFAKHGIEAWRNPHSITVVIPRPSEAVVRKWQIAPYRDIGHLILMPHVTHEMVDQIVADFMASSRPASIRCATGAGSRFQSAPPPALRPSHPPQEQP